HTRSKRDWSSDVCSSDLARSARYPSSTPAPGRATGRCGPCRRGPRGWVSRSCGVPVLSVILGELGQVGVVLRQRGVIGGGGGGRSEERRVGEEGGGRGG